MTDLQNEWKPDYNLTPRWVVCAALKKEDRIIAGARHYDKVMRRQIESSEGRRFWLGCEQGFIDQFGDFLTREEAYEIAEKNNQISRTVSSKGILYSENIY